MAKSELFPEEVKALKLIARVCGPVLAERLERERRVVERHELVDAEVFTVYTLTSISFNYQNHDSVTVYLPRERFSGKVAPAEVNWSAWGSVDPASARVFHMMLASGIVMAENLNLAVAEGSV